MVLILNRQAIVFATGKAGKGMSQFIQDSWLKRSPGIIFLIIVLGAWVRIQGLGEESFWVDEVFSARVIEGPVSSLLERIPHDKPPLDYFIQAVFHPLAQPEVSHRLGAALAGVILMVGVFLWSQKTWGRATAICVLIFAAFHFHLIYYSREARPYSLFAALITLQQYILLLMYEAWIGKKSRRIILWMVAFFFLSLASLYTLYAALLVFVSQIALFPLLLLMGTPVEIKRDALPKHTTETLRFWGVLLFLLIIVMMLALPLRHYAQLHPPKDYFWRFEGFNLPMFIHLTSFPFGVVPKDSWRPVLALPALILLIMGLGTALKKNRTVAWQLFLGSVLPIYVTPLIYAYINRSFHPRYTIFCLPGLLILYCLGLQTLSGVLPKLFGKQVQRITSNAPALFLTLIYAILSVVCFLRGKPYHPDWRGAAQYIAQNVRPNEIVIAPGMIEKIPMEYYLERFGHPTMKVLTQDEVKELATSQPEWMIAMRFHPEREKSPFHMLDLQLQGREPLESRLKEIIRELGRPSMELGNCPLELLGAGWSLPEQWGDKVSIRWITRKQTWIYLPLTTPPIKRLALRAFPYTFPRAPVQTMEVRLNGFSLGRQDLPANQFTDLVWDITEGTSHKGFNRLEMKLGYVQSPSTVKKNYADFRTLGAAVEWIKWESGQRP
jgi:4-amino-4-deoxy-L-arabinose transferase-like glycosyltransferase